MQPEVLALDRRVRPRTPLDLGLSRSLFVRASWSQRDVVASQGAFGLRCPLHRQLWADSWVCALLFASIETGR